MSISRLLPTLCAGCTAPGPPVCDHCQALIRAASYVYPIEAIVLGPMEGVLRSTIHALKYRGAVRLIDILAALLAERVRDAGPEIDAVVAVPSQKRNVRVRGYDQAARLGRSLARELGVAYEPVLRRQAGHPRGAVGQTRQGELARRRLAASAFVLDRCPGDSALVVDDVITTGATMHAATTCVQAAGVRTTPVALAATVRRSVALGSRRPRDPLSP